MEAQSHDTMKMIEMGKLEINPLVIKWKNQMVLLTETPSFGSGVYSAKYFVPMLYLLLDRICYLETTVCRFSALSVFVICN